MAVAGIQSVALFESGFIPLPCRRGCGLGWQGSAAAQPRPAPTPALRQPVLLCFGWRLHTIQSQGMGGLAWIGGGRLSGGGAAWAKVSAERVRKGLAGSA